MTWNPLDFGDDSPIDVSLPAPADTPIVVVDDDPAVLQAVGKALQRTGYPVRGFQAAPEALSALAGLDAALLITDIRMPQMSGIELARRSVEEDPDLAVIILTGQADTETAVESLRLGVEDYLTKPVDLGELVDSVQRSLRRRAQMIYRRKLERWLREEVRRRTEVSEPESDLMLGVLADVVRAMEEKDDHLRGHSERVARVAEGMAQSMSLGESELRAISAAGLLHDLGMVSVSDVVLQKEGKLTEAEYTQIQRHPEIGAEILRPLSSLSVAARYVRHHHERLNGSGYPQGLKGDEIPLGAQIIGLAESYAALTEIRPFRPACSSTEALEILRGSEGVWYARRCLNALETVILGERAPARG